MALSVLLFGLIGAAVGIALFFPSFLMISGYGRSILDLLAIGYILVGFPTATASGIVLFALTDNLKGNRLNFDLMVPILVSAITPLLLVVLGVSLSFDQPSISWSGVGTVSFWSAFLTICTGITTWMQMSLFNRRYRSLGIAVVLLLLWAGTFRPVTDMVFHGTSGWHDAFSLSS